MPLSNLDHVPYNFIDQTLVFEDHRIYYVSPASGNEVNVMMDWERPIMSASAAYVCEGGGDILELGFGMGISANYIQSHSIASHTICEQHPQIIEKAQTWASDKPNVTIVTGSWHDNLSQLNTYDGVFWDAGFTEDMFQFSSSLDSLVKSGGRATWYNDAKDASNNFNIPSVSYVSMSVSPPEGNNYFDWENNDVYYLPKKQF